jgi:ribosomal protein S11
VSCMGQHVTIQACIISLNNELQRIGMNDVHIEVEGPGPYSKALQGHTRLLALHEMR